MSRSVGVILSCDYPGCTRKPHIVLAASVSSYTEVEKLYRKKAEGWIVMEGNMYPDVSVFCPDHSPEVQALQKRMEGWRSRHWAHERAYGEKSGEAWAAKYPPPEVPGWLAAASSRLRVEVKPPTAKAVADLDKIEASGGRS